jgi:hypothetical protein
MRKTLLILLASTSIAGAQLSPHEFQQFIRYVWECGFYYSRLHEVTDGKWFYALCSNKTEIVLFVPMAVETFEEAQVAMYASMATYIMCQPANKIALDQLRHGSDPLPFPEDQGRTWGE